MSKQQFSSTGYPISLLLDQIDHGQLGLPDLQRPYVWDRAKVRDLFDSLYRGYPAGYFLFWSPPEEADGRRIGADKPEDSPPKMIVDGQQRLTGLYAVIKGEETINADNDRQTIRIAFNPLTEQFHVADAATDNDPEWLSSITEIWCSEEGVYAFTTQFIEALESTRDLSDAERKQIGMALGRVAALTSYQFTALELSSDLDIEQVSDVFQRVNSKGVSLNSADFLLTLMSVYWKEGRHELEDFALAAKVPSTDRPSPYNHFHAPSPDQLLRVCVGLGLKRGVLQAAYQVLRGKEPETGEINEVLRTEKFDLLKDAQQRVLNLTNWHQYTVAIKKAGYRSKKMLTSANNFLYGYLVFLIGKEEYGVSANELRDVVARWFFMASLTGRYTGSPETILEADLRRFAEANTADEFVEILNGIIDTQLTGDFWSVTLPDLLDSSAAWSPYLFGYYAALILLDARALFSDMKIDDLLDPDVNSPKSPVERHHLFPKSYLSSIGITGTTRTNQIGNFAFVEWNDNIDISDRKPADYFPEYAEEMEPAELEAAQFWHALAPDWENMDYFDFLRDRRNRIAQVVKAGYERLKTSTIETPVSELPSVLDLLRQMETKHVEFKLTACFPLNPDVPDKAIEEGVIKTVAAFLNSEGGTLAIGISDDGDVLGVQPDLDHKGFDLDRYQNWLTTLLMTGIGDGVVTACSNSRFEPYGSEIVCLVDVKPAPVPIYANTTKGRSCFYVRAGNTTRMLEGPEIQDFIKARPGW